VLLEIISVSFCQNLFTYSNPKWFVEGHPDGVSFHKPKKFTNDIGLLYIAVAILVRT